MVYRLPHVVIAAALFSLPAAAQTPKAPPDRLDGPPIVSAKGWAIADGLTGQVLWGDHEAEARPIASTTKIMTAFLVLKLAEADPKVLDEAITFSERAAKTNGSSSKLRRARSSASANCSLACCCHPATTPPWSSQSISAPASPPILKPATTRYADSSLK